MTSKDNRPEPAEGLHRRAETELRAREERHRTILQAAMDGFWIVDMQGRLMEVNAAYCRMSGYSAQELLTMRIPDLEAAETKDDTAGHIQKVGVQGEDRFESRHRRKDGSIFDVEVSVQYQAIEGGRLIAFLRDITERKQAEEALRASEARVQKKLQSILSPVDDIGPLELADMIDVAAIQHLMDKFYQLTRVPNSIIDLKGNVLVGTGWQDICTKFHRQHPETLSHCIECDTVLSKGVPPGTFKTYLCKNNLWDCVTPLMVGGKHVGNLFTGQFFFEGERPDDSVFRAQAAKYGFDESDYMAAVGRIPVWNRETINVAFEFYTTLANMITSLSHGNIALARLLEEQKRVAAALHESEEKFAKAFRGAPVWIAITDMADATYLDVNEEALRVTGFSREEVIGHTAVGIGWIQAEDRARLLREVQDHGRISALEMTFHTKDGRTLHGWVTGERIIIGGRPCLLTVTIDITDRKRAEEALRDGEKRHRKIVEASSDAFLLRNSEGIVIYANPAALELLRANHPENLIGKQYLDLVHPDDRALSAARVKKSMDENLVSPAREHRILALDGQVVHVESIGGLVKHRGETQMFGVFRDISERKQAEQEREKLQAQLNQAQKMESVGRLAGGVAHDFNNMLGVILGHAEMALNRMDPAQPLVADLQEIRKAAQRSADLTRQLLAFARKQTIAPKMLDLNETVESMLKMLRRLIGENIDLSWLPGNNLWPVKVDPSQIDQILANLCVNARDAIAGVGKVTIETKDSTFDETTCAAHAGFVPGEYVRLTVSDNGCGMDTETRAHIFEPFFTTKGVGEGTGLGLSTVYGIVKQNNGYIDVDSEPGQGTIFKIYLPRHAGQVVEDRKAASAEIPKGSGETVLLVEDEPAILNIAKRMLELLGYSVLAAHRPAEAIRLAEAHVGEIHLLMTDVVMPEMNGRDLAKTLLSPYPRLTALFMSGYTADVIAHRGVLDEGVCFIQKPFSIKDLAAKIRQALDR
jgi:two-component system cell cycle sensor histidine kinase/response regulator CckA